MKRSSQEVTQHNTQEYQEREYNNNSSNNNKVENSNYFTMASWFSSTLESIDASAALNKISELSSKVDTSGALNKIAEISSKVKESLPVDDELIGKLTLNSSEMMAERMEMEAQERRKETARNSLTKLLPWETKDEERDILIEECREAILALSTKQETFTLPISPPEGLVLFQTEENDAHEEDSEKEDSDEEDAEKEDSEDAEQIKAEAAARLEQTKVEEAARLEQMKVEAAARLEKIKPLPPILDEFDLDAHVGLIERLFKVDKELVKIHSLLTGMFLSSTFCETTSLSRIDIDIVLIPSQVLVKKKRHFGKIVSFFFVNNSFLYTCINL